MANEVFIVDLTPLSESFFSQSLEKENFKINIGYAYKDYMTLTKTN